MSRGGLWIRKTTRQAIYLRDGLRCAYCGACDNLTLDHIGDRDNHDPKNLLTCCLRCNSRKQDKSLRAWYAVLRKEGKDTCSIGRRVRRIRRKPLDREKARQRLAQFA